MSYVAFAWIASIAFGFETLLAKISNKHTITNPWLFNFLWALLGLVYLIPIASMNNAAMPTHWQSIITTASVHAIFSVCYILALSKLDVSVFSPLFNFKIIFSIILGYIFLHEVLTAAQLGFIGILTIAGFAVAMDEKLRIHSFFRPGVLILLVSTLLYAVFSVVLNRAIAENGYWTANLWIGIVNVLAIVGTFPFFQGDIGKVKRKQLIPIFILLLAGTIGNLTSAKAYAENVGISSAIIAIPFSMIMSIGLSFVYPTLLEKNTVKVYAVRITAASIMMYSAIQLSR